MNKITSNQKINDIVSLSQLKKKFKQYLVDQDHGDFKSGIFPRNLVVVLVMLLEEVLSDSLEYVVKNETNGIYLVTSQMIKMVISLNNKYDFLQKYLKKYNNVVKYQDSLFFNIKKVLDNLESQYGSKLMIDAECKNFISYLLLSVQYEFTKVAVIMVKYANRKTLTKDVLYEIYNLFLDKDISSKLTLKLEDYNKIEVESDDVETETNEVEVEEDDDDEEEEEDA